MGKQDIAGLLARHSDIERRHIKLWLTSTEVLDALLNSGITNRSVGALDRAKEQLRLWVPNPSFDRSREILEDDHVCVISGTPGIGKTMLANVLLADYASREYQHIAISDDIDEGDRLWRPNDRQIFLYDDFLGHVTYGELQLSKNEPSRLAEFFERVRKSNNKRLILTTREYILSEAMLRYEPLTEEAVARSKSVVSLEDYTPRIRAQILYNHLFFSSLPPQLKSALLPKRRYWDVIRHRNYNPRVIEHAVSLDGVESLSPDEFVSNILATLENPTRVWERIFGNLPIMARRVLLAVASLPSEAFLEDVQHVVESLSPKDFDAGEFKNAVSMVEGTFVNLEEADPGSGSRRRIVEIRDQSVRDYLWARLEGVDGEADALLKGAIFFEQCVILYEGQNHAASSLVGLWSPSRFPTRARHVVNHAAVASRAAQLLNSPTPVVKTVWEEGAECLVRDTVSLERRTAFLMSVLTADPTSQVVAASTNDALLATIEAWEAGQGSLLPALGLIKQASARHLCTDEVLERAQRALLGLTVSRLYRQEGFEVLIGLSILNPDLFADPSPALETWNSEFEAFLVNQRDRLLEEIDDSSRLEREMEEIRDIADQLGSDISELETEVQYRLEELLANREPDYDDDLRDYYKDTKKDSDATEIDALFQSLR